MRLRSSDERIGDAWFLGCRRARDLEPGMLVISTEGRRGRAMPDRYRMEVRRFSANPGWSWSHPWVVGTPTPYLSGNRLSFPDWRLRSEPTGPYGYAATSWLVAIGVDCPATEAEAALAGVESWRAYWERSVDAALEAYYGVRYQGWSKAA